MIRHCDGVIDTRHNCGRTFDDAKQWALCPHPSLNGAPPSREDQAAVQRPKVPLMRTSPAWCAAVEQLGEDLYAVMCRAQYTIVEPKLRAKALAALAAWEDLRIQVDATTVKHDGDRTVVTTATATPKATAVLRIVQRPTVTADELVDDDLRKRSDDAE
jgi:hypothetical protein